jgi:hypothetical protein
MGSGRSSPGHCRAGGVRLQRAGRHRDAGRRVAARPACDRAGLLARRGSARSFSSSPRGGGDGPPREIRRARMLAASSASAPRAFRVRGRRPSRSRSLGFACWRRLPVAVALGVGIGRARLRGVGPVARGHLRAHLPGARRALGEPLDKAFRSSSALSCRKPLASPSGRVATQIFPRWLLVAAEGASGGRRAVARGARLGAVPAVGRALRGSPMAAISRRAAGTQVVSPGAFESLSTMRW